MKPRFPANCAGADRSGGLQGDRFGCLGRRSTRPAIAGIALRMEGSALSLPWQVVHPGIDGAMLPICDEFSREVVALDVERRMEIKNVIRILDEGVPEGQHRRVLAIRDARRARNETLRPHSFHRTPNQ